MAGLPRLGDRGGNSRTRRVSKYTSKKVSTRPVRWNLPAFHLPRCCGGPAARAAIAKAPPPPPPLPLPPSQPSPTLTPPAPTATPRRCGRNELMG